MWITAAPYSQHAVIISRLYYFESSMISQSRISLPSIVRRIKGALPVPALLPGGSRIDMQKTEFFVVDDL